MNAAPTILLVEDEPATRRSVRELLARAYPAAIVLEAGDLDDARAQVDAHADLALALIDLGLPSGSGLTLIGHLVATRPAARVVVITIFDDDEHLFPALSAGAAGYLLKDLPPEAWLRHLKLLDEGMPALSPSVARRMLEYFRGRHISSTQHEPDVGPSVALTPRETEVLGYIARGLRLGEVAQVMGLRENTISSYVKDIYRKLNICSRAEAALEAARRGLV